MPGACSSAPAARRYTFLLGTGGLGSLARAPLTARGALPSLMTSPYLLVPLFSGSSMQCQPRFGQPQRG